MKIAFIGSRGIPAGYGGFETFVEEVGLGLSEYDDVSIIVVCDKYQKKLYSKKTYKNIDLIYSKYSKAENPNLYYWDSTKKVLDKADIIYSCGVGAAFSCWIPKLKGVKFVTNPDGMGWWRSKWSWSTKIALYTMFWLSTKTSEYYLSDSRAIADAMESEFNRRQKSDFIEYGAHENIFMEHHDDIDSTLKSYGLEANKYHLIVSRLEPENNVHHIIKGYSNTKRKYPLAVVGNLQDTAYVNSLKELGNGQVKFLDGIYDSEKLQAVRYGALTYLHGHSVGGTNPSLLEAMASKNLCICHDNSFTREVTDNKALYFSDAQDISNHLKEIEISPEASEWDEIREAGFKRIEEYYNWPSIISRYYKYFKEIYGNSTS
ncbi:DUF1972 domain-containing protein [Fodinibius salsisoli]|uniref:DUF1972 domain-containing protein n=1 Tax=Fodinibius salsisoli TaxID=2820877 RepID=A0ABT3PTH1_9BACT|nr:DUF1972 domain-containing protein [Fodinibius salsisoli]MCW9709127.1 DUF1972 domain-containing protein [Fodinibius salsisoli]